MNARAWISGRAGRAIVRAGDSYFLLEVTGDFPQPCLPNLLQQLQRLDPTASEVSAAAYPFPYVQRTLSEAWRRDRALLLALMAFDRHLSSETRLEAASTTWSLISKDPVLQRMVLNEISKLDKVAVVSDNLGDLGVFLRAHGVGGRRKTPDLDAAVQSSFVTTSEEQAILAHGALIWREVHIALRRAPWAQPEDLYQVGAMGLLDAIRSKQRDSMLPFEPYARTCVRNAITSSRDFARGTDRRLLARVAAAATRLARGVHATPEEIAAESARFGGEALTVEQVERALRQVALANRAELEALVEEGGNFVQARPPSPLAPAGWGEEWTRVLIGMARDCGLDEDGTFVLASDVFGLERHQTAQELGWSEGALRVRRTRIYGRLREHLERRLRDAGADGTAVTILLAHLQEERKVVGNAEQQAERLAQLRRVVASRVATGASPRWLLELVGLVLRFVEEAGGR